MQRELRRGRGSGGSATQSERRRRWQRSERVSIGGGTRSERRRRRLKGVAALEGGDRAHRTLRLLVMAGSGGGETAC